MSKMLTFAGKVGQELKRSKRPLSELLEDSKLSLKEKKIEGLKAKFHEMVSYCYRMKHPADSEIYFRVPIAPEVLFQYTLHSTMTVLMEMGGAVETYCRTSDAKHLDKALAAHTELRSFYSELPMERLNDRKDLYPLAAVRLILENIGELLAGMGNPDDWTYLRGFIRFWTIGTRELLEIYTSSVVEVARELKNESTGGWMYVPLFKPECEPQVSAKIYPEGDDVPRMKEKAAELARHYFKGMTATSCMIIGAGELYLRLSDDSAKSGQRERILRGLAEIKACYDGIPFEKLPEDARYYPLFLGKPLVGQMETAIGEFLEKPDEIRYDRVCAACNVLLKIGKMYAEGLNSLLARIHGTPEGKDFFLEVRDINGDMWQLYNTYAMR